MEMHRNRGVCLFVGLAIALTCFSGTSRGDDRSQRWIATWTTSNQASEHPTAFSNQTLREIVHTTIGGASVRIILSNTFGPQAVHFDAVFVGLQKDGASLVPKSNRQVTFGGSKSISIPEGAEVLSDPIALTVEAERDVAISLFVSGDTGPATSHGSALVTNYIADNGNSAAEESADKFAKTTTSWFFLGAIQVPESRDAKGAVVALGDSITDGGHSRPEKNERWTDVLARRLLAKHAGLAVLNAGIGGNRILTSSPCWGANALARMGRDVLSQAGIEFVILFEGTNDIGQPDTPGAATNPCFSRTQVTPEEVIVGYKQIIARTHARGLKIFGATILPYQGYKGWTAQGEAKRVALNQWIRTSGAFDGVIDFDAALRDPSNPQQLDPKYDPGDHLHPNSPGHEAMANAVNLALFR